MYINKTGIQTLFSSSWQCVARTAVDTITTVATVA